jgi:hypothetical protein
MTRIDRIAHPCGVGTSYGPGEPWPQRVDSHKEFSTQILVS